MLIALPFFASMIATVNPVIGELAWRGQLRALVEYPKSTCMFGIFLNSDSQFRYLTEPASASSFNPQAEFEKLLLKDLDCQALTQMASHYERSGETANAVACERMALALCRRHLRQYPDDVEAMGDMAYLLSGSRSIGEAEKWLRLGVSTRPRDWHAWERLGWHYLCRAYATLLFSKDNVDKPIRLSSFEFSTITMTLSERAPETSPEARRLAIDLCQKARDAFDWCVLFAPEQFEARVARFIVSQWLMPVLQVLLGDLSEDEKLAWATDMVRLESWGGDIRKMAELSNDPRGYGLAFFIDFARVMATSTPSETTTALDTAGSRHFYETGRRRLRVWSQSTNPQVRANAHRVLALLEAAIFDDKRAALEALHQVPFDTCDPSYYEFAKFIFMFCEDTDEFVRFFERWIKETDSPVAYFDFAMSYSHFGKLEEARALLKKGMDRHPTDFQLMLAWTTDLQGRGGESADEKMPVWLDRCWRLQQRQSLLIQIMGTAFVPTFGFLPTLPDAEIKRFRSLTRLLHQCQAVEFGLVGLTNQAQVHIKNAVLATPDDYGNAFQIASWLDSDAVRVKPRKQMNIDAHLREFPTAR